MLHLVDGGTRKQMCQVTLWLFFYNPRYPRKIVYYKEKQSSFESDSEEFEFQICHDLKGPVSWKRVFPWPGAGVWFGDNFHKEFTTLDP